MNIGIVGDGMQKTNAFVQEHVFALSFSLGKKNSPFIHYKIHYQC